MRVNVMAHAGQSVIYDMRARLFEHLQALSLGFYSRYSVGRVITRVINDVGRFAAFYHLCDCDRCPGYICVGRDYGRDAIDGLASFADDLCRAAVDGDCHKLTFRKRAREMYRQVRSAISWVNSVLAENINGVRVVQAFSREPYNYAYFRDEVNTYNLETNLNAARVSAGFFPTIDFLGTVATALVIWLGGRAVLDEIDQCGGAGGFHLVYFAFLPAHPQSEHALRSMLSTMAGGERIFALMDTPVEVQDAPEAGELPRSKGHVEFRDVCFHYEDDDMPVLQEVSIKVKPGQTIAWWAKLGRVNRLSSSCLAAFMIRSMVKC